MLATVDLSSLQSSIQGYPPGVRMRNECRPSKKQSYCPFNMVYGNEHQMFHNRILAGCPNLIIFLIYFDLRILALPLLSLWATEKETGDISFWLKPFISGLIE
jgi:hypothetical protein